jgi:hypothetical protein
MKRKATGVVCTGKAEEPVMKRSNDKRKREKRKMN